MDHSKGQAPAALAVMEPPDAQTSPAGAGTVASLRTLALQGLERMYDRDAGRFVFRVRRCTTGVVREGLSDRYTAITAIGLAGEEPEAVRRILGGDGLRELIERLIDRTEGTHTLGDLALAAWAGHVAGCATDRVWDRILALDPVANAYPTVEI